MDRVRKLIEQYNLEEDAEYVILPIRRRGEQTCPERRIYILRRPYLIVRRDADHAATVPLDEIIEAILRNPDGRLWDELKLSEREAERLARANAHAMMAGVSTAPEDSAAGTDSGD